MKNTIATPVSIHNKTIICPSAKSSLKAELMRRWYSSFGKNILLFSGIRRRDSEIFGKYPAKSGGGGTIENQLFGGTVLLVRKNIRLFSGIRRLGSETLGKYPAAINTSRPVLFLSRSAHIPLHLLRLWW